jgi:hypothetical protein
MVHLSQMNEIMIAYNHTLDLARFAVRNSLPLHKQLKNIYRQNIDFQSQNRKIKVELRHLQDQAAQRNLQVLLEVSIKNDKPTAKESSATPKNIVSTRKKKCVEPIEETLSTIKSVRLSVKMTK